MVTENVEGLAGVASQLQKIVYEQMVDEMPDLVREIETAVYDGFVPREIEGLARRMGLDGRIAKRCFQVACYLGNQD